MNLLYLDHAPIFGGAEVVLLNLITALDRERYAPLVVTSANASFRSALAKAHIESVIVPFGRLNQSGAALPFHLMQAVRAVMRLIRDRRIDLIHSNTVRTHIVGSIAAWLTRTPIVWTLHDNTFPRRLVRALAPIPRRVITVSQWIVDLYGPCGLAPKIQVIYNGLNLNAPLADANGLREELGVPIDAPLVVNVGRLVAGKAPHHFVRAAQITSQTKPGAYFVLVGGPDQVEPGQKPSTYTDELAQVVKGCNLGAKLIMTGHRSDVARFYAAASVLVYTSIQPEGLPTVLLEAMRYAAPIIATTMGGAAEIVQNDITGRCVLPNDVDALAAAMTNLLNDRDHAHAMGLNGRDRLTREFDLQMQTAKTMQVYDQVLSKDLR